MAEATRILTALALCCGFCMTALSDDWPGWLGAERDSVWRETGILKTLPADGLRAKWRTPVAAGYAGVERGVPERGVDVLADDEDLGRTALDTD